MIFFKKQISKIPYLYNFYHFYISGRFKNNPTELIRRAFRWHPSIFFVQVGSNDGKTGDPLYPLIKNNVKWKGLFIEPVPYLFERLQSNYSFRSGFYFENSAVNDGSRQIFYWVDPSVKEEYPDLPSWFDQVNSFKETHIYGVPEIREILLKYRRQTKIEGITFEKVLEKYGIANFDLLHIDVEGYDWNVLSQVNLSKYKPKVILFEHKCLSEEQKSSAINFLSPYYSLKDIGADMFCIRKSLQ